MSTLWTTSIQRLCFVHSVAWYFDDGDQQSAQGGWLWLSPHAEEYGVSGMWSNVRPRWRLLQQHIDATGPLFTNRSNQPGDDMKDEVRTDDDWHAESDGPPGTGYGVYVSLVPHCSFLVSMESLPTSITRSERKSMLCRYSFLEVSKMYQLAEWKRGSKSRMLLLLAHSCQLCIGLWLFPAEDEVRAGDV